MWRGKPNCICSELEWLNNYGGHVERLKNVKAFMKFKGPVKADYNVHKAKMEAIKKRRDDEIYAENMKLLKRILTVDTSFSPDKISPIKKHNRSTSLNQCMRRKTEKRIFEENQALLSRLRNVKSVYNKKAWQKDHQKHLLLSQNISQTRSQMRTRKLSNFIFYVRRPQTAAAIQQKDKRFTVDLGRTYTQLTPVLEDEGGTAQKDFAYLRKVRPQSVQAKRPINGYEF